MSAAGKHLRITGRVQGVSYRAWFERQARLHGLTGWVRNRADGSVEAVIHGTPALLERMIGEAWQGPARAAVSGIDIADTAYGGPEQFEIRPTE